MYTIENKENCQQNNTRNKRKTRHKKGKESLKQKNRKRPSYERVVSSRLIRQVKKTQVLKKLNYNDMETEPVLRDSNQPLANEFRAQIDLKVQPKDQSKVDPKPYHEDFFSNWETYHVCKDYAEDIINYLKERDVSFVNDFS